MSRNDSLLEFSLLGFVRFMLRNRRLMLWIPAIASLMALVIVLLQPRRDTSMATFMAQTEEVLPSSVIGLASEFGLSLPGTSSGQSPGFYVKLLESRPLLRETVTTPLPAASSPTGEPSTLVGLLDPEGNDEEERIESTIRELERQSHTEADAITGLITLEVTTTHPRLSSAIGSRMVELVDRFNVETRKSQASAERSFIEDQIARTEDDLTAAEDDLKEFIRNNRRYSQSPDLSFERDRLNRRLTMIQSVLTSLANSYERARMEEVRGTPVITIVEPAHVPARPDPRSHLAWAILVGAATFSVCAAFAAVRSALESAKQNDPEDFASLRSAWMETVDELLRPFRRFRSSSAT